MKEESTELKAWFSTYGLLTAERILDRFHIYLKPDELALAVQNSENIYYQLLLVPLKNIFNGIILGQASDYRVYAQKLFVDYLISGESSKPENTPGAATREEIEQERLSLVEQGISFEEHEYAHLRLIAESQAALIHWTKNLPEGTPTPEHFESFQQLIAPYIEKINAQHIIWCDYRSQFYNLIVRSTALLQLLTDYRPDMSKQLRNRAEINFNAEIGEA